MNPKWTQVNQIVTQFEPVLNCHLELIMIILFMFNKTLEFKGSSVSSKVKPPDIEIDSKKPKVIDGTQPKKVDINVLKARAQVLENKEKRKNIFIFIFILANLSALGIYLST